MRFILFFFSLLFAFTSQALKAESWSILWVVDNSGSMQANRGQLARHAPEFISRLLKGGVTDFRMAMTTTDVINGGGDLITDANGVMVIDQKTSDPGAALASLANAVVDTPGSFWEQGLEASYQAITQHGGAFLKDGDRLAVIYVSDEDDYSCEADCFGVQPENNPDWKPFPLDRYKQFFSQLKADRNIDTLLFPIVGILEGSCDLASYGVRYLKVLTQVGGLAGSVCGVDFPQSLFAVADRINQFNPLPVHPKVLKNPVIEPTAYENQPYRAELSPFVQGSGLLTFTKLRGPGWLSIGGDGSLRGTPSLANLGANQFTVAVRNQEGAGAIFTVRIAVEKKSPAIWINNPVNLSPAIVRQPYFFDLRPVVANPDGGPLVFRALNLPAWLTANSQGLLFGTPTHADLGSFTLSMEVSNGLNSATASLVGSVVVR